MTPFCINFPDEHGILCSEIHCEAWHETIYSLALVVVLYEPLRRIVCPLTYYCLVPALLFGFYYNKANLSRYPNVCFLIKSIILWRNLRFVYQNTFGVPCLNRSELPRYPL